jgi:hypothetical protein
LFLFDIRIRISCCIWLLSLKVRANKFVLSLFNDTPSQPPPPSSSSSSLSVTSEALINLFRPRLFKGLRSRRPFGLYSSNYRKCVSSNEGRTGRERRDGDNPDGLCGVPRHMAKETLKTAFR